MASFTRAAASVSASTKGERALAALALSERPRPRHPPPVALLREATLRYDPATYDLAGAVASLLGAPADTPLERYVPEGDTWSMAARLRLQKRVRACAALCNAYERLVADVIAPSLARHAPAPDTTGGGGSGGGADDTQEAGGGGPNTGAGGASCAAGANAGGVRVLYQFPPTLRIHAAQSKQFRRVHRDAEFGHQPVAIPPMCASSIPFFSCTRMLTLLP